MDIKQCYLKMNGDYADVRSRFRTDERIERFLKLLPGDDSFSLLEDSLAKKDYETAFRAVHTLKGVAMNLALTSLVEASSALTEALRDGNVPEDLDAMLGAVRDSYQQAVDAVAELSDQ